MTGYWNETTERAAGLVTRPYRVGVAAIDKVQLAANSTLFNTPSILGAKTARVFTHSELTAPASAVAIEAWIRRMNNLTDIVNPTAFIKTANNGSTYTDYSSQVIDDDLTTKADLDSLDTLANQDYVLVCYSAPFVGLSLEIDGTNKNAVVNTLLVKYRKTGAWQIVTNMLDTTRGAGASFNHDGEVEWDAPTDWVSDTFNGVTGYWVQLSFSASLSANVDVQECGVLLDYVQVGKVGTVATLTGTGKFVSDFDISGDDIAVLYRTLTGGGSAVLDINLGFH